jgi:isopenicillin N synthase-like dioxygenase
MGADLPWDRWHDYRERVKCGDALTPQERAEYVSMRAVAKHQDRAALRQQRQAMRPYMQQHRELCNNLMRMVTALRRMNRKRGGT